MLFILLLALILFGPKRLPEIARQIGKFVAEFKRASNDFKYQLQAEIDKASPAAPAASHQGAQQSSPSTPTLYPGTPKTGVPGAPLLPPAENAPSTSVVPPLLAESGRAGDPDSEHERLMRTARMAYEAQAFTLRPPEPPPHPSTPTTGVPGTPPVAHVAPPTSAEPSSPAEPVSVPSAPNSAPASDSTGHGS